MKNSEQIDIEFAVLQEQQSLPLGWYFFQNRAETMHLPHLPIKAASTAIILNYY